MKHLGCTFAILALLVTVVSGAMAITSLIAGWNYRPWMLGEVVGVAVLLFLDFCQTLQRKGSHDV